MSQRICLASVQCHLRSKDKILKDEDKHFISFFTFNKNLVLIFLIESTLKQYEQSKKR